MARKRILVVGLGSMGKRRIRNMLSLGYDMEITGFDLRNDRLEEAKKLFNILLIQDVLAFVKSSPDLYAIVVSVPPAQHHIYMKIAAESRIPAFVEASVVDTDMEAIIKSFKQSSTVCAPSGTLYFHPAIKNIYEIVRGGELGGISSVIYHSGQYLPDWHSYEEVSDYYVSKKETGGAREIVPFELTWLTKLFGFPKRVTGVVQKTIQIGGAEQIDDTYHALLDYDTLTINLTVDVVSRAAVRKLLINGSEKQLVWNWDENNIQIFNPKQSSWNSISYEIQTSASGYNKNITEQMYIDELKNFFEAVEGQKNFFNDLEYDHKVLKILYAIEEAYKLKKYIEIK